MPATFRNLTWLPNLILSLNSCLDCPSLGITFHCCSVLSSLPTLGGKSWKSGDTWRARSASLLWGAPSGVQRQSPWWGSGNKAPWSWKHCTCSLRASHGNGKIVPFSLFCKLNTHMHDRPTMYICVFRTIAAMFEVPSMWNVPYCHSRQYNIMW